MMSDEEVNSYFSDDVTMGWKRIQAGIIRDSENNRLAEKTNLDKRDISAGGLDFALARRTSRWATRISITALLVSVITLLIAIYPKFTYSEDHKEFGYCTELGNEVEFYQP